MEYLFKGQENVLPKSNPSASLLPSSANVASSIHSNSLLPAATNVASSVPSNSLFPASASSIPVPSYPNSGAVVLKSAAAPVGEQGLSTFARIMNSFTKNELFQNLCKLSLFSLATIITVKWMIKQLDPTNKQKRNAAKKAQDILCRLGVTGSNDFTEYELMIASHLMDPKDINLSWKNIGGLDKVIDEIKETVILPIRRQDLFNGSKLSRPPKGVLLHGPPGCGKTMIAKATAKEAGTKFINLDLSILTDKWYGESQKLAAAVFSLAVKLQPCIIFIDEIDSFLRSRNTQDHEATAMMKAQFMTLWDGLCTDPQCTVIVMGATNRPHDLDKAILRRMPATFHIPLPGEKQRLSILKLILDDEPIDTNVRERLPEIAKKSEGFSGSDIKELCRNASMYRVRDYMSSHSHKEILNRVKETKPLEEDEEQFHDTLRQITLEDLNTSLNKMKITKVNTSSLTLD